MQAFADTNITVYAQSDDGENSRRARSIIESSHVIGTQVIGGAVAALAGKYGFSKADVYRVAGGRTH